MRTEALFNTIRHIPDLVRKMPNPRQNPIFYLYWGTIMAGCVIGDALFIHGNDEATKHRQVQAIIDAQKAEQRRIYDLTHNPAPTFLPDGRIETHINDKGEITTTRFVDRYISLDSKPQEDVPWRFSTDPTIVRAKWAKADNTIYVTAVNVDAAGKARDYLTVGLNCQPAGTISSNGREGLISYAIPVQNLDCIKPHISE